MSTHASYQRHPSRQARTPHSTASHFPGTFGLASAYGQTELRLQVISVPHLMTRHLTRLADIHPGPRHSALGTHTSTKKPASSLHKHNHQKAAVLHEHLRQGQHQHHMLHCVPARAPWSKLERLWKNAAKRRRRRREPCTARAVKRTHVRYRYRSRSRSARPSGGPTQTRCPLPRLGASASHPGMHSRGLESVDDNIYMPSMHIATWSLVAVAFKPRCRRLSAVRQPRRAEDSHKRKILSTHATHAFGVGAAGSSS